MINNLHNQLRNFYNNRGGNKAEAGSSAADLMKRLREKRQGKAEEPAADEAQAQKQIQEAAAPKKQRRNYADAYAKSKNPETKTATQDTDTAELSSEEKRQASLKKIMARLDAEEAARFPSRAKNDKKAEKSEKTEKQDGVTTPESGQSGGVEGFLNDLPLFNEFKTSLVSAFRSMDSATAGSISAQYELNYTSMQYIATEAGYEYSEKNFNLKIDLNYIKAGAGDKSAAEIADAIENAEDFESLMSSLKGFADKAVSPEKAAEETKGIPELKDMKPEDFLTGMKDYFGPEATSGRIVDFATMFFPMSDEFKNGGDTEEARKAFSDRMGKAIQKGFDQALGSLGKLPKDVQDGIDKTHELTFKGLEDFVKNGMSKKKEEDGVYNSLEQFAFSFEMSYTEKRVSASGYNARGQAKPDAGASAVNTEA